MSAMKETQERKPSADQDGSAPNLSETEQREAEQQKRPRAAVIHEAVRAGGEE